MHLRNAFSSGELETQATTKDFLVVPIGVGHSWTMSGRHGSPSPLTRVSKWEATCAKLAQVQSENGRIESREAMQCAGRLLRPMNPLGFDA